MKTYLSKVFYFLGDLVPFKYSFFYSLHRMLMLISINLDRKNIVWESHLNKETKKKDFIVKLIK
tara:strand:- start:435 stop:626 length:192 start_codon:yes stop_codon:yes gene_type:complete